MDRDSIFTTINIKGDNNPQITPINLSNIQVIEIDTYGAGQPDEILKITINYYNLGSKIYFMEEKEFIKLKEELYFTHPHTYIELVRRSYTNKDASNPFKKILSSVIIDHANISSYNYKYRRYGKIHNTEIYNRGCLTLEWLNHYTVNVLDINLFNAVKFKSFMELNHYNKQPPKWDITQFTDTHGAEYIKTLQEYMISNIEGE